MKGVADRTLELMNEYQADLDHKSWRTFQHFLVVKIETLEDDVEAARSRTGICEWKYDEFHNVWETSCSNLWQFNSDGPEENECQYCMYCGGVIDVLPREEQPNA